MSILINMEMPKSCNDCNFQCFAKWGGNSSYANEIATKCLATDKFVFPSDSERDENCPLIEVPKHGRLIDADALKTEDGWLVMSREQFSHIQFVYANAIVYAPTIIEAEGDDGN